jgi:hypothetical protein
VVAFTAELPESFSSGSISRARIVAANSNDGNGNSTANTGMRLRVGTEAMHDDVQSKPELRRPSQEALTHDPDP